MKKLIVISVAILLAASCAFQAPVETGSITLAGPRILNIPRATDSLVVRYVLTRDGEVIPLNERPALEIVDDTTLEVTINNLLPGAGYRLALSVGYKPEAVLEIDYYGSSQAFSIAAGSNTEVALNLEAAPAFIYLTSTGSPASATVVKNTVVGNTVYILDGATLKAYVGGSHVLPDQPISIAGVTVNSISTGKYFNGTDIADELWLNTTGGIYRGPAGGYAFNMKTGLAPNVTMSGAVELDSHIFGIYTGGGTAIGFLDAETQGDFTSDKWYTLDSVITDYHDQAGIISGISTDIIRSIAVNEDNAVSLYYAVTALGTVMGSQELKTVTDDPNFSSDPLTKINPYMMTVADGSSIEVVSSAGNRVVVGTTTGLYTDVVMTSDAAEILLEIPGKPLNGLITPISGTAGLSFTALASYKVVVGTNVITAAVSENNDVFIIENGTYKKTLDAASGVPENARPVFHMQGDDLYLLLTGTNGAVDYDTGY